jgi:Mrp family chromosome partitioning ATPase
MALAQPYRYGTTVLLEADVEKPSLAATLELQQAPGVADVLEGASSLEEAIQWTGQSVGVVTAGSAGTDTSVLLSRLLRRNLVGELRELADSVIVDLPPFVGPGVGMARACPRVVVVVRAGSTPFDRLERVAAELDHPPVIVNRADERLPRWLRRMFPTTP